MIEIVIDDSEFKELPEIFERMGEVAMPYAETAMQLSVDAVVGVVAEYPPSTEANEPGRMSLKTHQPMGYYERGAGWWYPVKRVKTLGPQRGTAHGAKGPKNKAQRELFESMAVAGYKLRMTSERLMAQWTTRVNRVDDGLDGIIGNRASYKDYVNGMLQARIHAARGWKRIDAAIAEVEPDIDAAWKDFLDKLVQLFKKS